jgi:hypothetical protein
MNEKYNFFKKILHLPVSLSRLPHRGPDVIKYVCSLFNLEFCLQIFMARLEHFYLRERMEKQSTVCRQKKVFFS